ncbi:MAG TPA: F0F1 ATP synthase subunit delta [Chromatiales bacterium]|nr:F0F1 ATP synthase subunit delta [Chromatiales bacterium]
MSEIAKAARAYARAAFEVAEAKGQQAKWSEMLAFLAAVAADADMGRMIASPSISRDKLVELVLNVAQGRLSAEGENLVRLLGENARLDILPLVAVEFEELRRAREGRMDVRVVSAKPLSADEQSKLVDALGKRLGKVITLANEIDESLIGGAIVYAGDLVIDGSMRGRLQGLANAVVR